MVPTRTPSTYTCPFISSETAISFPSTNKFFCCMYAVPTALSLFSGTAVFSEPSTLAFQKDTAPPGASGIAGAAPLNELKGTISFGIRIFSLD